MKEKFNFDTLKIKMPNRHKNSHKGDFGKVLIAGGASGMGGASILSSEASLFCGAGLVHLETHLSNVEASLKRNPEIMAFGGSSQIDSIKDISVVVCGPGLKDDDWSYDIFEKIIATYDKSVLVLDAGALHFLPQTYENIKKINTELILTPHPGEASKLLNISVDKIQENRSLSAKEISNKYNASVILKGNETIIYSNKDSMEYQCSEGGPELSTGGTGDVLAGIISALVAQKINIIDSCLLSVAVHARAGKIFKENIGEIGLNASSLISIARDLLNK